MKRQILISFVTVAVMLIWLFALKAGG